LGAQFEEFHQRVGAVQYPDLRAGDGWQPCL
jgi:hypothetical protein